MYTVGRSGGASVQTTHASSPSDGALEIVGLHGPLHLGRLKVDAALRSDTISLARAVRIAQGSKIEIMTTKVIPMQIDGEPWMQVFFYLFYCSRITEYL